MKNDDKMGTKNILPLLVEFSIPAIIGMLVNAIYISSIVCLSEMHQNLDLLD